MIKSVLRYAHWHFINELKKRKQLCVVKDFQFNYGVIPDYTDLLMPIKS